MDDAIDLALTEYEMLTYLEKKERDSFTVVRALWNDEAGIIDWDSIYEDADIAAIYKEKEKEKENEID